MFHLGEEITSVDPLNLALKAKTTTTRIVWWTITIVATLGLICAIGYLILKFQANETNALIQISRNRNPFPAVTFCNKNPYKRSALESLPQIAALVDKYNNASQARDKTLSKTNRNLDAMVNENKKRQKRQTPCNCSVTRIGVTTPIGQTTYTRVNLNANIEWQCAFDCCQQHPPPKIAIPYQSRLARLDNKTLINNLTITGVIHDTHAWCGMYQCMTGSYLWYNDDSNSGPNIGPPITNATLNGWGTVGDSAFFAAGYADRPVSINFVNITTFYSTDTSLNRIICEYFPAPATTPVISTTSTPATPANFMSSSTSGKTSSNVIATSGNIQASYTSIGIGVCPKTSSTATATASSTTKSTATESTTKQIFTSAIGPTGLSSANSATISQIVVTTCFSSTTSAATTTMQSSSTVTLSASTSVPLLSTSSATSTISLQATSVTATATSIQSTFTTAFRTTESASFGPTSTAQPFANSSSTVATTDVTIASLGTSSIASSAASASALISNSRTNTVVLEPSTTPIRASTAPLSVASKMTSSCKASTTVVSTIQSSTFTSATSTFSTSNALSTAASTTSEVTQIVPSTTVSLLLTSNLVSSSQTVPATVASALTSSGTSSGTQFITYSESISSKSEVAQLTSSTSTSAMPSIATTVSTTLAPLTVSKIVLQSSSETSTFPLTSQFVNLSQSFLATESGTTSLLTSTGLVITSTTAAQLVTSSGVPSTEFINAQPTLSTSVLPLSETMAVVLTSDKSTVTDTSFTSPSATAVTSAEAATTTLPIGTSVSATSASAKTQRIKFTRTSTLKTATNEKSLLTSNFLSTVNSMQSISDNAKSATLAALPTSLSPSANTSSAPITSTVVLEPSTAIATLQSAKLSSAKSEFTSMLKTATNASSTTIFLSALSAKSESKSTGRIKRSIATTKHVTPLVQSNAISPSTTVSFAKDILEVNFVQAAVVGFALAYAPITFPAMTSANGLSNSHSSSTVVQSVGTTEIATVPTKIPITYLSTLNQDANDQFSALSANTVETSLTSNVDSAVLALSVTSNSKITSTVSNALDNVATAETKTIDLAYYSTALKLMQLDFATTLTSKSLFSSFMSDTENVPSTFAANTKIALSTSGQSSAPENPNSELLLDDQTLATIDVTPKSVTDLALLESSTTFRSTPNSKTGKRERRTAGTTKLLHMSTDKVITTTPKSAATNGHSVSLLPLTTAFANNGDFLSVSSQTAITAKSIASSNEPKINLTPLPLQLISVETPNADFPLSLANAEISAPDFLSSGADNAFLSTQNGVTIAARGDSATRAESIITTKKADEEAISTATISLSKLLASETNDIIALDLVVNDIDTTVTPPPTSFLELFSTKESSKLRESTNVLTLNLPAMIESAAFAESKITDAIKSKSMLRSFHKTQSEAPLVSLTTANSSPNIAPSENTFAPVVDIDFATTAQSTTVISFSLTPDEIYSMPIVLSQSATTLRQPDPSAYSFSDQSLASSADEPTTAAILSTTAESVESATSDYSTLPTVTFALDASVTDGSTANLIVPRGKPTSDSTSPNESTLNVVASTSNATIPTKDSTSDVLSVHAAPDSANFFITKAEAQTKPPEVDASTKAALEHLFDEVKSDDLATTATAVDAMAYLTAGMSADALAKAGYSLSDVLMRCTYNGVSCGFSDFKLSPDPNFGNCYTFNADGHHRVGDKTGALTGLSIIYNVGESEYLEFSQTAGVRVVVHEQTETVFPDIMGINVASGYQTSATLTKISTNAMPFSSNPCAKSKTDVAIYNYNEPTYATEACIRSCYQNQVIAKCQCGDPRILLPSDARVGPCDLANRTCVNDNYDAEVDRCECPRACHIVAFEITQTTSKWPSFYTKHAQYVNQDGIVNVSSNNDLARIDLFFESNMFYQYLEKRRYTWNELMWDISSISGLALGISVISVFELIKLEEWCRKKCCK